MGQRDDGLLRPCGTEAAYRRHYRRGEKPCWACLNAELERQGKAPARAGMDDHREPSRNGLPTVPYRWRARSYPQAQRALAAAEAVYGTPAAGDCDDGSSAAAGVAGWRAAS